MSRSISGVPDVFLQRCWKGSLFSQGRIVRHRLIRNLPCIDGLVHLIPRCQSVLNYHGIVRHSAGRRHRNNLQRKCKLQLKTKDHHLYLSFRLSALFKVYPNANVFRSVKNFALQMTMVRNSLLHL